MLSLPNASTALVPAAADAGEVELLSHKRCIMGHDRYVTFCTLHFDLGQALSAALGTCMSSWSVSLHASEWPRTDESWLVSSPRHHIRSTPAVDTHGEAVMVHSLRPSAMPCRPSVRPSVRPSMAIHKVASLALERLLPRACRDLAVLGHA